MKSPVTGLKKHYTKSDVLAELKQVGRVFVPMWGINEEVFIEVKKSSLRKAIQKMDKEYMFDMWRSDDYAFIYIK